ncbi:amastin-like surface protein [Leishmania donovani]|nr:amastin-like surface protein [Leishmania donovani]VDZ48371.1 amastin-like_surface_protein_putative/GeneDB:LmjF.34.1560/GeneDB:LmjF.34.1580/GeneDB:LmjF.34.1600/GeneDB:LmjF.34.1620/GeneDB:LmjF.34.1640/GeneDB:LmjF.34.1660/GeneDB:LmjF.34.1680/GeneDB:LmjF.34.1700/GeneDB:LmjF.34.1720/GeneDB:LmjF.34.1740/GeneDB:LmjF.34.1760/GeneDB:LmjF.34.1780/GeneDB:LmjF.34.1800/GeneDB:LmjF.34.1820/GeneDB:LmjF.34.1860/GeneDB:LmjF.34.1880/GeneDB:LmjF.34.1900/GeneDB:LmjF.34.1920/GeneDB:LmjF.34.1940/GeneDB:LmjF.34.1960/
MFRIPDTTEGPLCFTLWGDKVTCDSSGYLQYVELLWKDCPSRITRFRLAQGCAIISIFVYFAALVLGFLLLYGVSLLRWVCLVLNVVGMVTSCVVWAAMAVTYNKDEMNCFAIKTIGQYGAGFVLFVLAWILDVINIIILLLPCTAAGAAETDKKAEPPTAQE